MCNAILDFSRRASVVVTFIVTAAIGHDAIARPNLVYETQHHSEIGTFDEHLSKLCAMRLFNQDNQYRHSAYFESTRILLGAAMGTGWNLNDVTGARRIGFDYWFRNDGFSNCEVYFAPNKQRTNTGTPRSAATGP